MTKRADDKATRPAADHLRVLSRKPARPAQPANSNVIAEYDATDLIGLRVIVCNAAIQHGEGEDASIELPMLDELMATAAVARCLMAERLRGYEVKAMRKILRMTLAELANSMDEKTAVETVSRWEGDQPMGGYAEKVLRLFICEKLSPKARGISYSGSMIAYLKQRDPWRVNPDYELPPIVLELGKVRHNGDVGDAWTQDKAAA